jgi:hypothetical protein
LAIKGNRLGYTTDTDTLYPTDAWLADLTITENKYSPSDGNSLAGIDTDGAPISTIVPNDICEPRSSDHEYVIFSLEHTDAVTPMVSRVLGTALNVIEEGTSGCMTGVGGSGRATTTDASLFAPNELVTRTIILYCTPITIIDMGIVIRASF